MPPVSVRMLLQSSRLQRKGRDETDEQFMQRLTHANLMAKSITEMRLFSKTPRLKTLLLYENSIKRIQDLQRCSKLTQLYLQHNCIAKIENLSTLTQLTKLHLGYNEIAVVEGLESLTHLCELHIEHQRLNPGCELRFASDTLQALQGTVQVLNVAGDGLTTVSDVGWFKALTQLNVSGNMLRDMEGWRELLQTNVGLVKLSVVGNPLAENPKHQDNLISMSTSVEVLDGRDITAVQREFLANWHDHRARDRERRALQEDITQKSGINSLGPLDAALSALPDPIPATSFRQKRTRAATFKQGTLQSTGTGDVLLP